MKAKHFYTITIHLYYKNVSRFPFALVSTSSTISDIKSKEFALNFAQYKLRL